MTSLAGQTLSRYRFFERFGEGGTGVVWKAIDTRLNRRVALSILPPELTSGPVRCLGFRHEAQAIAALNHPCIATMDQVGEHDKRKSRSSPTGGRYPKFGKGVR